MKAAQMRTMALTRRRGEAMTARGPSKNGDEALVAGVSDATAMGLVGRAATPCRGKHGATKPCEAEASAARIIGKSLIPYVGGCELPERCNRQSGGEVQVHQKTIIPA